MTELLSVYEELLGHFGPQGWWPMTRGFSPPGWEVCIGAILTQNTGWNNVEKALANMKQARMTGLMDVLKTKRQDIEKTIRPSGFYKQKAERLKIFADFVMGFGGFRLFSHKVTREQMLKIKGIGPETADSILLYALGRPVFVIDAYTKRIFTRLGFDDRQNYDAWRMFFESRLPKDTGLYKEFHALIVELAKTHCKKEPVCDGCPLEQCCEKLI